MRILVTVANGFIGRALCRKLVDDGFDVRGAYRKSGLVVAGAESVTVGVIDGDTDWAEALLGVDVVIHLAARVHVTREESADPAAEFDRVNVRGTLNLSTQAVRHGVRRFVFLSSIKVNGDGGDAALRYSAKDQPRPMDPFSVPPASCWIGGRR